MLSRILLLALSICLCFPLAAQQKQAERQTKRAKNRAENRAQNKVDRSVDKAVDEVFEGIGGLFKKKKKKKETDKVEDGGLAPNDGDAYADEAEAQRAMINAMGGGGEFEPYTNPHAFSITMEVTEVNKKGKESTSTVIMAALPTQTAFQFVDNSGKRQEASRMILDTQTGKTTVVTEEDGEKTAVRMRMPNMSGAIAEAQEDLETSFHFERTGERKTIRGYDCEKIIVTDLDEDAVTESWVTQDLELTAMDLFGGIAGMMGGGGQKMNKGATSNMKVPFEGFPIESTTTQKNGTIYRQSYTDIQIGEASMNKAIFNLDDVEVQELPGF